MFAETFAISITLFRLFIYKLQPKNCGQFSSHLDLLSLKAPSFKLDSKSSSANTFSNNSTRFSAVDFLAIIPLSPSFTSSSIAGKLSDMTGTPHPKSQQSSLVDQFRLRMYATIFPSPLVLRSLDNPLRLTMQFYNNPW